MQPENRLKSSTEGVILSEVNNEYIDKGKFYGDDDMLIL